MCGMLLLWQNDAKILIGGSDHGVAISFAVPDRCDWGSTRRGRKFLKELLMMDWQATSEGLMAKERI